MIKQKKKSSREIVKKLTKDYEKKSRPVVRGLVRGFE